MWLRHGAPLGSGMQARRNRVVAWSSRDKPSEAPAQDQSPAGREPQDARFWDRYDCLGARVNPTAFHLQNRVEHLNHTLIIHKLSPAEHRFAIRSWRSAIGVARVESQIERNTWIGKEPANRLAEVEYGLKRRGYSGSEGARGRARFV